LSAKRYRSVVEKDENQILEICAIEMKSSFGERKIGCGNETENLFLDKLPSGGKPKKTLFAN